MDDTRKMRGMTAMEAALNHCHEQFSTTKDEVEFVNYKEKANGNARRFNTERSGTD